jgi:hypothetical protein
MTYESGASKSKYAGNGVATAFPTGFKFVKNSHVACVLGVANSTGGYDETDLEEGVDYSLAGEGSEQGGTVTYPLAGSARAVLAIGQILTVHLTPPIVQAMNLSNSGSLDLESIEAALDLQTMVSQSLKEKLDRTVSVKISSGTDPADLLNELAENVDAAHTSAQTATNAAATATAQANAAAVSAAAAAASAASLPDSNFALTKANNLSDLANAAAARGNLGLKGAAILEVGTAPNTVCAGDDPRLGVTGMPTGYITGLSISFASTTTFSVMTGAARDGGNTEDMALSSAMTKSLSAWASGTGNGGLDTGGIAPSTYYYVWLITKDDGTTDVLLSASATAPAMPSGYTFKRLIGRIYANSSSQIDALTMISANPAFGGVEVITQTRAFLQVPWGASYKATVVGGGAGAGNGTVGSYGGGAAAAIKWVRGQAPLTSIAVTIGAGGVHTSYGASGTASSFGSICTAGGGLGSTANNVGGLGGTPFGGDINVQGMVGMSATTHAGDGPLGLGCGGTNSPLSAPSGYGAGGQGTQDGTPGVCIIEY